jgi:hypothetical protein
VLVLTRCVTESVMVGDDVMITVFGVKGNQVRIGHRCAEACRCAPGGNFRPRTAWRLQIPEAITGAFSSATMHR